MPRNELAKFLKRSIVWMAGLSAVRGGLRLLIFLSVATPILAALDFWLDFSHAVRLGLWFLLAMACVVLAASGFWPLTLFSISSRSRELSKRLGGLWRTDELRLINGFLLGQVPAGASRDLTETYLARSAELLRKRSAAEAYPLYPWRQRALAALMGVSAAILIGLLLFPDPLRVSQRLFWPFRSFDMEACLRVEPGDADVPWGGDATIHVTCLVPSLEKPSVLIHTTRGWNKIISKTMSGSAYDFPLEHLTDPVVYRVDWGGESSRRYTLTPVKPIAITSFDITITPPAYTGDSPVRQSEPALSVLPGSQIQFGIQTSQPLDGVRLTPPQRPPVDGKRGEATTFSFLFPAEQAGSLSIEGKLGQSWRPLGDAYSLQLSEDKAPSISLLSPDQDLVVGEKENLPLTYEASDDVGLSVITLEWQRPTSNPESREIQRFEAGKKSILSTFDWDLPQQKFRAGEIIRYRLVATDRNSVTGPGRAVTPWRTLEIRSFEQAHEDLEKELEAWRGEALDALAASNALKKKLGTDALTPAEQNEAGKAVGDSTKRLEERLKRIVSHLEADPMADYAVWMEHRAMEDNLSAVNRSLVPEMQQALAAGQKPAAQNKLSDLSAELERMAALSEDLSKRQKARDVREAGEDLGKMGEDLAKDLSKSAASGHLSEADKRRLDAMLDDAQKTLEDIAKSLQQFPQELPEDFVNQAALKQINLAQSQDVLSKIREAMAKGDAKGALALAEQFQAQVKALRDQLSKAHQGYESGRSAGQLAKTMSEEQKKLNQIAQDQMDLLGKTQALESKRMEAIRKKQADRLKALAKRQAEVVRRAEIFVDNDGPAISLRIGVQSQGPAMVLVLKEFSEGRLEKSPEALEKIVNGLKSSLSAVSLSTAPGASEVHWMEEEETALREEIKKQVPEDNVFDNADRTMFNDLQSKQAGLRETTGALRSRLQKLSRQTASLGLPLTQALGKAGENMEKAAGSLGQSASGPATRSEEEALQDIMEAQSAMEQASGQASEMAQQEGGGSGSGPRIRVLGRSGGVSGGQTAPVRIPTEQDYRPPVAFREELLKSLKEKYPSIYEDVIHKYYRRLTE